ncbi:unnamed protein product, partial [Candidula unifasciata]
MEWFILQKLSALLSYTLKTHVAEIGLLIFNCSDLSELLANQLSDKAEVLDYSRNKFTTLPIISESKECPDKHKCTTTNSTYHCRLDISFSRNQISNFTEESLRAVSCLRTLDLSFNELTADAFNANTFQSGVYYLQRLILNNNPIGRLPGNVITQPFMPYLRELDLSHCHLEDLSNKRQNQLTYMPENIFGDLVSLKVLLLSDNKIQGFHEGAFYRYSSLEILDLRNNQLTSVPYTALDKLTKLQSLDLSQNPIRQVTRGPITSGVQTLALDNIPDLAELGPYSLASFTGLVSLSVSGNKALQAIHPKFLGDNPATLKHVRLENNKLSTLGSDALPWKQLTGLKLGGNPWYCDNQLGWMIKAL